MISDLKTKWGGDTRSVVEHAIQEAWNNYYMPPITTDGRLYLQVSANEMAVRMLDDLRVKWKCETTTQTVIKLIKLAPTYELPEGVAIKHVGYPPLIPRRPWTRIGVMVPEATVRAWVRIHETRGIRFKKVTFETLVAEAWIKFCKTR